jgi:hypothetical protein
MNRKSSLTIADKILILISALLVAASYIFANATTSIGSSVIVQVDGKTVYKASLVETRSFVVRGVEGLLTVETRDGKAAITHADCPNHICVKTGWRSKAGEIIVCVPNKTVVRIVGDGQKGVQATTG